MRTVFLGILRFNLQICREKRKINFFCSPTYDSLFFSLFRLVNYFSNVIFSSAIKMSTWVLTTVQHIYNFLHTFASFVNFVFLSVLCFSFFVSFFRCSLNKINFCMSDDDCWLFLNQKDCLICGLFVDVDCIYRPKKIKISTACLSFTSNEIVIISFCGCTLKCNTTSSCQKNS